MCNICYIEQTGTPSSFPLFLSFSSSNSSHQLSSSDTYDFQAADKWRMIGTKLQSIFDKCRDAFQKAPKDLIPHFKTNSKDGIIKYNFLTFIIEKKVVLCKNVH